MFVDHMPIARGRITDPWTQLISLNLVSVRYHLKIKTNERSRIVYTREQVAHQHAQSAPLELFMSAAILSIMSRLLSEIYWLCIRCDCISGHSNTESLRLLFIVQEYIVSRGTHPSSANDNFFHKPIGTFELIKLSTLPMLVLPVNLNLNLNFVFRHIYANCG